MFSIIDVFLFEAALFILVVTGCFVYGVVSQAFKDRRERQVRELEAVSDELLKDMLFGRAECRYPFGLIADEMRKRASRTKQEFITIDDAHELLDLPPLGVLTVNEIRKAQAFVQVANGDCNANVIGSNNVVNCGCNDDGEWEEERFYSDGMPYLVMRKPKVPDAYGTEERK